MAMLRQLISESLEPNEEPQHTHDPRDQENAANLLARNQTVGKVAKNRWSLSAPSDPQNEEINKATSGYQSREYIRRPSDQRGRRFWPWHLPPSCLWAMDASLIYHHQDVDVVIA